MGHGHWMPVRRLKFVGIGLITLVFALMGVRLTPRSLGLMATQSVVRFMPLALARLLTVSLNSSSISGVTRSSSAMAE